MNQTKPVIAILGGTGKEGPGLALRWANAGYTILIGSRQAEKAQNTAQEINQTLGIQTVKGYENAEAARRAEICVLTVVQTAHQEALTSLKEVLQGKILVDATARVDFRNPKPPEPPAAARIAQEILGEGVRVVAAFQNVPAAALRKLDQPVHGDVLICADDLEAAEAVMQLARDGGMNAYYAGGLDNAIVVEGLTALLISLNKHYKSKTASIHVAGLD
ncbi:MAG: NADPH-dependent F420 reductase [Anaerolineales bacterium]|nr:NADPH-dependent F420 reductase [Anaerolineales bacterium]MCS7248348.1 NADPH-dependent F420 reductase [Anaerolineales bacterium]MDW8162161.1 NADPH-dependent F420 reductase [Anaerolineales bacterium]MDW8446716.1 NADPH-dependent F420 reductase [Anaerolineales bacterium]